MRLGPCNVTVFSSRNEVAEAPHDSGIGDQFGEELAQRGDLRPGPDERQLGPAVHDDPLGSGPTLGLIRGEQLGPDPSAQDGRQLPAKIHRILQRRG